MTYLFYHKETDAMLYNMHAQLKKIFFHVLCAFCFEFISTLKMKVSEVLQI